MSEKRFRVMSNESKQLYCIESVDGEMFSMQEIVDMLNSLNNENIFLAKQRDYWKSKYEQGTETLDYRLLQEKDDKIKKLEAQIMNKEETIIHLEKEISTRENDLTIVHRKNKELQTENLELVYMDEQLREINKDIGDDLYNCRLNKNIISEKLKLWQDILEEHNIYTLEQLDDVLSWMGE